MNIENELQTRVEHFTALKFKYQATKYKDSSPLSLLYLILRKVDLGIKTIDLEFDWLKEHQLFETIEVIQQHEQHRAEELRKLDWEFEQIKFKYKVSNFWQGFKDDISAPLYSILWKLNSENQLTDSEVEWLKKNQLVETLAIVQEMKLTRHFIALKAKYQATQHQDSSPDSPLYKILKKLDTKARLGDNECEWLINSQLFET